MNIAVSNILPGKASCVSGGSSSFEESYLLTLSFISCLVFVQVSSLALREIHHWVKFDSGGMS